MASFVLRPDLVQSLVDRIRGSLSPQRQCHVMGVAHTATMLAARHGLDVERALVAGLLHDIYKECTAERLRGEVERLGGAIAADDQPFPNLWHGLCAGLMARSELGIDDPEIYEAVMLHTTADANVSALTRLLFVADYAEPGRKAKSAPAVLEAAIVDLEEGFRQALRAKIEHMHRHGKQLSVRAIRALLAYLPPEAAVDLVTAGIQS